MPRGATRGSRQIERLQRGEDLGDVVASPRPPADEIANADAKARVKDAGLDKILDVGDQPTIRKPAFDIMLKRAQGSASATR